jgi:hypothetical protein
MTGNWIRSALCVAAILGIAVLSAAAQQSSPARVLLIDETKTFLSTMRVAGLVGALRGTGVLQVDVRLADVGSGFDDPLAGVEQPPDLIPYPIAVIVTRGVDSGVFPYVWILSGDVQAMLPGDRTALDVVTQVVSQVFAGVGTPVGVYEDLYPALLWALYVQEGWMD